jgi:hypothetical protein
MIVYKRDVNGVSNCSREAVHSTICPRLDTEAMVATTNLSLSSHQLCVRCVCVCAPPGRVSTLVCTQAREQPQLAHKIPRHRLQRTQLLGEFCRPSEGP